MTNPKPDETFPRLAWNQAAIWMGADFFALWRLLLRNRFHVRPAFWGDMLIDLSFGAANTGLRALQALMLAGRDRRVEIAEEPIFVVGHWRTGTTLLHELLALDPRHRYATTYECFVPNHFLLTERLVKSWSGFVLPPNRPPDNMQMGWDLPQEDEFALCNLGLPSPYLTIAFPNHPPQCQEYLELDEISPSQRRRWQRGLLRFLKQLTYKQSGRIVLKSPTHTFRLPILNEMFPRARFVHIVRNPFEVFPSTVRLWKSLYAAHGYQQPNHAGLEQYVFDTFVRLHHRLEATRGLIEPERFHEVRYEQLVQDPVFTMRRLYDHLDLGAFDEVEPALRKYVEQHADYRPNRYELAPELRAEIAHRWKPYFDRYGYTTDVV